MKIYVLVYVFYDYYRFQDNISASLDKQELIDSIEGEVLEYKVDSRQQLELDGSELVHYWVQEFGVGDEHINI